MSRRTPLAAVFAAAAAVACVAVSPAGVATSAASPASTGNGTTSSAASGYVPGSRDDANNAKLTSQLGAALARKASNPRALAARTTVYYDASRAPYFSSTISQAAQIWSQSERNVQLVNDPSRATLRFYEGNDRRGSYASTNGHGSGYILIDYAQTQRYDELRVVAHETGHALGLPDHYSGPCSELMSGGGPGTSCTNAYPNSQERYQVDSLWAYGFAPAAEKQVVTRQAMAIPAP